MASVGCSCSTCSAMIKKSGNDTRMPDVETTTSPESSIPDGGQPVILAKVAKQNGSVR